MTLVSVLMPIKGDCPFLTYAIQSVRLQTFSDWELVICKDAVDEDSEIYLRKIIGLDARIKLVDTVGLPLPSALNKGLKESQGSFIARFDADDIMLPSRIKNQVNFFLRHPDVVACGGQIVIIDEHNRLRLCAPYYNLKNQTLKSKLNFKCPFPHPGTMISTRALNQVGGYSSDFKFAEDYELWLRLAHLGKFANLRNPVIAYRSYTSQTSARFRAETRLHMATALIREFNREFLEKNPSNFLVDVDSFREEYLLLGESKKGIIRKFYHSDPFLYEILDKAPRANLVSRFFSYSSDFLPAIPRRFAHVILRSLNSSYAFLRTKPLWDDYLRKLSSEPVPRQSNVYLER